MWTAEVSRPGTLLFSGQKKVSSGQKKVSSGQKKVSSGQKNIVLGTLFLDKNVQLFKYLHVYNWQI